MVLISSTTSPMRVAATDEHGLQLVADAPDLARARRIVLLRRLQELRDFIAVLDRGLEAIGIARLRSLSEDRVERRMIGLGAALGPRQVERGRLRSGEFGEAVDGRRKFARPERGDGGKHAAHHGHDQRDLPCPAVPMPDARN
jgi:hypothetical protein